VYVFHILGYVLLTLLVSSGGGSLAGGAASLWRRKGLGRALTAITVLALCGMGLVPMLVLRWEAVREGHVPDFSFSGLSR
jgi:preprotein translocase subunit SecG